MNKQQLVDLVREQGIPVLRQQGAKAPTPALAEAILEADKILILQEVEDVAVD